MLKIQDFTTGKDFTPKKLEKEIKAAASSGKLQGLGKSQEILSDIAKKRQSSIRAGGYDSYRRKADYEAVLKSGEKLNDRDKKHVKDLFEHWSKKPEAPKKPEVKAVKKAPPKRRRRDISEILNRGSSSANKPYNSGIFSGRGSSSLPSTGLGKSSSMPKRPRLTR